jgi:hypothetical protein
MQDINNDFVKALETELRREEADFRDLMNDFEFVKELNKELSLKYQDFVDSLPKPAEIDILINKINSDLKLAKVNLQNVVDQDLIIKYKDLVVYLEKRLFQLSRFRSAAVILEKQDAETIPIKYEELFGNVKP